MTTDRPMTMDSIPTKGDCQFTSYGSTVRIVSDPVPFDAPDPMLRMEITLSGDIDVDIMPLDLWAVTVVRRVLGVYSIELRQVERADR